MNAGPCCVATWKARTYEWRFYPGFTHAYHGAGPVLAAGRLPTPRVNLSAALADQDDFRMQGSRSRVRAQRLALAVHQGLGSPILGVFFLAACLEERCNQVLHRPLRRLDGHFVEAVVSLDEDPVVGCHARHPANLHGLGRRRPALVALAGIAAGALLVLFLVGLCTLAFLGLGLAALFRAAARALLVFLLVFRLATAGALLLLLALLLALLFAFLGFAVGLGACVRSGGHGRLAEQGRSVVLAVLRVGRNLLLHHGSQCPEHLLLVLWVSAPGAHLLVVRGAVGELLCPPAWVLHANQQGQKVHAQQIEPTGGHGHLDQRFFHGSVSAELRVQGGQGCRHGLLGVLYGRVQSVQSLKGLGNLLLLQCLGHSREVERCPVLQHISTGLDGAGRLAESDPGAAHQVAVVRPGRLFQVLRAQEADVVHLLGALDERRPLLVGSVLQHGLRELVARQDAASVPSLQRLLAATGFTRRPVLALATLAFLASALAFPRGCRPLFAPAGVATPLTFPSFAGHVRLRSQGTVEARRGYLPPDR